jgi:outer membrane autotransporter protein
MFQSEDVVGRVDGDFEGDEFGFYTEATHAFGSLEKIEASPYVSLAYSHIRYDSFNETGSSALRMSVDEGDTDSAMTSLGFRATLEREMDQGVIFRPRIKAAWLHEWADIEREVQGEFAAGGGALNLQGAEMPRDIAEVSVGWEVGFNPNANVFVNWNGRFSEDLVENALAIGVRASW